MIETINKDEFITMLAEQHGMGKTEAKDLYEKFVTTHEKAVKTGKRVLFGNLYRVQAVVRKGGKRRNPRTGETVEVPARARLKIIAGKAFEDELTKTIVK